MAAMNLKLIVILSISHAFIDLTGGALPAVMPFLKEELELNYAQIGAVIMFSNLTSSIIQPFFGYVSDKRQIRWLLPMSVALTYVGFSFIGLSPTFLVLLIFVIINGIGIACYHPEGFKVMHSFTGSRMATGMSFFQVGGNLGLALGPLLATYALQAAGLSGTLLFVAIGLPILGILVFFRRELTSTAGVPHHAVQAAASSAEDKRGTWTSMGLLVLAVTMRSWAHMGLLTFIPFYYMSILKGDALTGGRLVFIFLIGGAVGTMIGGMAADKIGHKNYFLLSMVISIPLLFLLLQASGAGIALILFVTGLVLISSFSVTIVMGQQILHKRLGMASGLMMGFVIGMGGVGAGLLGVIADAWGVLTVLKLIALMPVAGLIPILLMNDPMRKMAGEASGELGR
jgi:FSR family fosmidomycin resistance protein-like MFS transporter